MTIKNLKELIAKMEAAGVPENTEVYSEQARSNETDCFVIVRDRDTEEIEHVYISDASPDELVMFLEGDNSDVEIIY